MEEEEDFGSIGVTFSQGEEVEIVMANVEILESYCRMLASSDKDKQGMGERQVEGNLVQEDRLSGRRAQRTLMPSSEKHGGTAELSSSASERRMGNFSTADMGMSPR